MHLILLGPPGSGKGTQAQIVAGHLGNLHVSTGDMLRAAVSQGTALGKTAKEYMDRGALVPDELVIAMLIERINETDAAAGFILDGFPRNLAQAVALDEALTAAGKKIDLAIHIGVPDEELVRRLSGRWLCRACGAIYQQDSNPPRVAGKCDNCGGELYQRDDDKPETVRARLVQQKPSPALIAHYRDTGRLTEVDGMQSLDKVTACVLKAIEAASK